MSWRGLVFLAYLQETKIAQDSCYKRIIQDIKDRQTDKQNTFRFHLQYLLEVNIPSGKHKGNTLILICRHRYMYYVDKKTYNEKINYFRQQKLISHSLISELNGRIL